MRGSGRSVTAPAFFLGADGSDVYIRRSGGEANDAALIIAGTHWRIRNFVIDSTEIPLAAVPLTSQEVKDAPIDALRMPK